MRHTATPLSLIAALVLAAAVAASCGSSPMTGGTSSGAGGAIHSGATSSSVGDGGCFLNCSGGGPPAGALTVACDTMTIDVLNGSSTPAHCVAKRGGSTVDPSWVVDLSAVAGVNAMGVVTATGTQGGDVVVKATYDNQSATASLKVTLKKVLNPAGVSDVDQAALTGAADADVATTWAYPYDGTVFPKGLLAPEMMWNGGGAGDKYYVHLKSKYADFAFFTLADAPSRVALDQASWQQLTESGPGGAVALHVARLPAGAQTASVVVDHTWTIANGSLRGTVYYWSNNLGRVVRIKPGATAPDDFLKNDVGLDSQAVENKCTTCHAVSANGSTLVIGGDLPVTTIDLLTNKVVLDISAPDPLSGVAPRPLRTWSMPALSPNGLVLIENAANDLPGPPGGEDGMWEARTGKKIVGTGLDGVLLDMPAFAPNGTKIAFVDHVSHGLSVYDYDASTNAVKDPIALVPAGGDKALSTLAFPSVSPDAQWIVYHRGSDAPSPNAPLKTCAGTRATLDTRCGPADLYLASIAQPGVEMALANANGDTYPFAAGERDRKLNFEPTFAPLNSGGYMWVVFTARRTYGNRLTNGNAVTGQQPNTSEAGVKQLWVVAIDQNPKPGQDPSHPAFWVPGQDMNTLNMRGFWALDPCKQVGGACGTGSECCNQNCDQGVCKDPDPNSCAMTGNGCTKDGDCCDPKAKCINDICSEPPPT